jgi:D-alanyl-D-alanine carboxypeptidase (penicillin-binding protein 5/6)
LFRDPTVDGLKTGHTDAAGFCLVATAKRDFPNLSGRRLLVIVLGASSENARAEEAQKLLNWGFIAYDGIKLFEANQAVVTPAVYKGQDNQVGLGRPQAIVVAVPQGQAARLKTLVTRPDPLFAPLAKHQPVANLKVMLDQAPLTEIPLLALSQVDEAGFFGRTWDALTLWLK